MLNLTSLAIALAVQAQPAPVPETAPAPQAAPAEETAPAAAPKGAETTPEAEQTAQDGPKAADKKADENETVCRRTKIAGSNFTKRLCATRKEWATLRQNSTRTTREMQTQGQGLDPNGG